MIGCHIGFACVTVVAISLSKIARTTCALSSPCMTRACLHTLAARRAFAILPSLNTFLFAWSASVNPEVGKGVHKIQEFPFTFAITACIRPRYY